MSEIALPAPVARSTTPPAYILVGFGFLEVLIFFLGIAMGATGRDMPVVLLALVTMFLGAIPIVADMVRPAEKRQLLISLMAATFLIFLVLPVFTQYFLMKGKEISGSFHLAKSTPTQIAHAQAVALLGLSTFMLGFYVPIGRAVAKIVPRFASEWSPRSALTMALATLAIGWTIYLLGMTGLLSRDLGSGALGSIATGSYFGIAMLTLTWLRHRRRDALVFLVLILPVAMAINFFTGSKRLFLTPPFMVAISFILFERRIRRNWLIAGFAALIILYPASQFYRAIVREERATAFLRNPAAIVSELSRFLSSADLGKYMAEGVEATGQRLDALGALAVIVANTPERVPYQGGWTIGLIFVSYVPRVLWPGKPATTIGEWVSQTYGSPEDIYTDVGPSWVGEFFFNWGYLGVIFGMFTLGVYSRVLQERLFHPNATIPAMLGACVVIYYVSKSVQSGVIGPVNGIVYQLPPIILAHVTVGVFGGYLRQPRSNGSP